MEWIVCSERHELRRPTNWIGLSVLDGTNCGDSPIGMDCLYWTVRIEETHQLEWIVCIGRYELRRLTNWNGLSVLNGTN